MATLRWVLGIGRAIGGRPCRWLRQIELPFSMIGITAAAFGLLVVVQRILQAAQDPPIHPPEVFAPIQVPTVVMGLGVFMAGLAHAYEVFARTRRAERPNGNGGTTVVATGSESRAEGRDMGQMLERLTGISETVREALEVAGDTQRHTVELLEKIDAHYDRQVNVLNGLALNVGGMAQQNDAILAGIRTLTAPKKGRGK